MSSYLTIKFDRQEMAVAGRSSKLYSYCNAPFYYEEEEPNPVKDPSVGVFYEELADAISNAIDDKMSIQKRLDDIEWLASHLQSSEELFELNTDRRELLQELEEADNAYRQLKFLDDIRHINPDAKCYWWKD